MVEKNNKDKIKYKNVAQQEGWTTCVDWIKKAYKKALSSTR